MTKEQQLRYIFENDKFGLFNIKPKSNQRNAEERLVSSFQVIVDFYEENSREPEFSKLNIQECQLYYELKGIRLNKEKCIALKDYDIYGLLDDIKELKETPTSIENIKEINSIDDLLENDRFGIFDSDDSIFEIKYISVQKDRAKTDFLARRKSCKEFEKFEPLFKQCHIDLKDGNRKLIKFSEDDIKKGSFFIVDGMLVYVAETNEIIRGKHSKLDGRIKCIFENGTESNLLFRSLGKALYKNGQSVTEKLNDTNLIKQITDEDKESGFIYILKSKSTNPEIKSVPNLYKIGFSTIPVNDRIKNAIKEPTYLMADVEIIDTYKCYNLNPQKFENLIHSFFGDVCLSIDIYDNNRNRHTPREWFSVPLHVIDKAIRLIIDETVISYKYDSEKCEIVSI
jgi:hypothetical protein